MLRLPSASKIQATLPPAGAAVNSLGNGALSADSRVNEGRWATAVPARVAVRKRAVTTRVTMAGELMMAWRGGGEGWRRHNTTRAARGLGDRVPRHRSIHPRRRGWNTGAVAFSTTPSEEGGRLARDADDLVGRLAVELEVELRLGTAIAPLRVWLELASPHSPRRGGGPSDGNAHP